MNRRLIPADILHPLTPSDLHLTPDPTATGGLSVTGVDKGHPVTPLTVTTGTVAHDSAPDFLGVDLALPGTNTALLLDAVCHPTDSDLEDS